MTPAAEASRLSRPAKLTLVCLGAAVLVGLGATAFVALRADPSLQLLRPGLGLAGVGVGLATVGNLAIRFLRWHYILRRFDLRLPTIPNLTAYIGSFAFLPIPLYLGQFVARARLAPPVAPEKRGFLLLAFLWERVLDITALAVLAAPALSPPAALAVLATAGLSAVPRVRAALLRALVRLADYAARILFDEPVVFDTESLERCTRGPAFAVGVGTSLAAWGLVALAALPLVWVAGLEIAPPLAAGAAARSVLLGALSLSPLGVGVSGILFIGQLTQLAGDALAATQISFLFRLGSVWLTVAIGAIALWLHHRRSHEVHVHDHFDAIDECYDAWLPQHYRAHLVDKKTRPVLERLGKLEPGSRGLDIGCGRGWYLRDMQQTGADMVGLDHSRRQLVAAGEYLGAGVPLVHGSVLPLPFRSGSFDFAYIINVLHHVPTPAEQRQSLREIARVVRPGGSVFVHEMNVINPLFRFYLSYAFPILKGIEEGTEYYLDPREMQDLPGLALRDVHYFTFIPDFVPAALLPAVTPVERWLERSRFAYAAAHFLAVYERDELSLEAEEAEEADTASERA